MAELQPERYWTLLAHMSGTLCMRYFALQSIARVESPVRRGGHLWLDRGSAHGCHPRRIERRTEQALGKAIWPHLFRDCAVTELVDSAPEEIGIAPDPLRHADLQTTRKHYIQARGTTAHVRIQEVIAARRRAAAARRMPGY